MYLTTCWHSLSSLHFNVLHVQVVSFLCSSHEEQTHKGKKQDRKLGIRKTAFLPSLPQKTLPITRYWKGLSNMQYFIQSAALILKYHTLMHIFLLIIKTCPKTSWQSHHPESRSGSLLIIARQANYHPQTELFPRKKETKGSAHYANKTWDILTCKVLQDSQWTLFPAPIKLQLPVHKLSKTHSPASLPAFYKC